MAADARIAWLAIVLAACGGAQDTRSPTPTPTPSTADGTGADQASQSGRGRGNGSGDGDRPVDDRPVDSDVNPEELRVAAIERAMNQVSPAAHLCWAAGAADDYRLAGAVRVLVSIDAKARGSAQITADATGDAVLTDCLRRVLEAYPWPSALAGEAVELPFAFRAPSGQNVIDRRFVPHKAQQGADLAVLIDGRNSGNPAASMIEVALAPSAALPLARVDRHEAWYFFDPVELSGPDGKAIAIAAGDAAYLGPGVFRSVRNPGTTPARWLIAAVPGGPEGSARAGALPTVVPVGKVPRTAPGPEVVRKADATRYPRTGGATTIYLEPVPARGKRPAVQRAVSLSVLEIDAGVKVPVHRHATETELLYLLAGGGSMSVGAVELPVGSTSVVQVAAGVEHGFVAAEATTAIQLYAPPGPEQRFKTAK